MIVVSAKVTEEAVRGCGDMCVEAAVWGSHGHGHCRWLRGGAWLHMSYVAWAVCRSRGREIDWFWVAGILCSVLLFMSLHLHSWGPHKCWLMQHLKSISMEAFMQLSCPPSSTHAMAGRAVQSMGPWLPHWLHPTVAALGRRRWNQLCLLFALGTGVPSSSPQSMWGAGTGIGHGVGFHFRTMVCPLLQ